MRILTKLAGLWKDRRGAVGVLGALSVMSVLGMGAFAVDIDQGYHARMRNQRVADMAALAAAVAYQSAKNAAILTPTAQDVVLANGLTGAAVVADVLADTPAAGKSAVRVTVTTAVPFALGNALGFTGSYDVVATSMANLPTATPTPACYIGLNTGTAISTSGGATINTPNCGVAGVGDVNNGGTGITAASIVSGSGSVINNYGSLTTNLITYANNFTNPSWNTNVPAADKRIKRATTITDPLAGHAELIAARALIGNYTAPAALSNPSTSTAADWTFNYSPAANVSAYRVGTTAEYRVPAGTYNIGKLTVAGGITVTFQGSSTVNIHNGVANGGSALTFGDGTYRINGGFNSGSSGVTFGNADVSIGSGTVSFQGTNRIGNGTVVINAALSLGGGTTFTAGTGNHSFTSVSIGGGSWINLGAGDLSIVSGLTVGGGSTFAAGNGNVRLGPNGSNVAVNLDGSGNFIVGNGLFSANGNFVTAGGSRMVFGETNNHYFNGNLTVAGAVLFGAGRYTVNGNFTNGTGGQTWPFTSSVTGATYGNTLRGVSVSGFGQAGVDVTFVALGTINLAGGVSTKLIAPSVTTPGGGIADVLFSSLTSSATNWAAGSSNIFVGAVHLPNSAVTMSGGNSTNGAGQCFMLIANTISVTGGAQGGSACSNIDPSVGGASTTVGLIR